RQQVAKTSARILFIQAGPSELSLLVRYIPNRVHQSARCPILAQLGPRPMSAAMRLSGDTRTSTLIRELLDLCVHALVRTHTGCVRCAAIVPARAVRACATVSWRPIGDPGSFSPMMGRRGRAHAHDNDTGGRR